MLSGRRPIESLHPTRIIIVDSKVSLTTLGPAMVTIGGIIKELCAAFSADAKSIQPLTFQHIKQTHLRNVHIIVPSMSAVALTQNIIVTLAAHRALGTASHTLELLKSIFPNSEKVVFKDISLNQFRSSLDVETRKDISVRQNRSHVFTGTAIIRGIPQIVLEPLRYVMATPILNMDFIFASQLFNEIEKR